MWKSLSQKYNKSFATVISHYWYIKNHSKTAWCNITLQNSNCAIWILLNIVGLIVYSWINLVEFVFFHDFIILYFPFRAFDAELLYIAQSLKIPISEVAVTWTEIDGSKVTPVWSWIQMGMDLVIIWLRYTIGAWKIKPLNWNMFFYYCTSRVNVHVPHIHSV